VRQDLEWTFGISVLRIVGLRESRGRVAHQCNSQNREERKAEVNGEKCLVFDVSGFRGRRGKTFDIRIHKIVKSGILKGKGESPSVSWVLIVEFMPVQRSREHNSEGPVTYTQLGV
jgi:hypothetical protein